MIVRRREAAVPSLLLVLVTLRATGDTTRLAETCSCWMIGGDHRKLKVTVSGAVIGWLRLV
jgi:hypothetical protein